jgi:hypothetical protein
MDWFDSMATLKQISANQINAKKSTGPRSDVGKEISSSNSLKHGILAKTPLLSSESQHEFDNFRSYIFDTIKPLDGIEAMLTERLVLAKWRLKRLYLVESDVLTLEPDLGSAFAQNVITLGVLSRYEQTIERAVEKTLEQIERLQFKRGSEHIDKGITVTICDYLSRSNS